MAANHHPTKACSQDDPTGCITPILMCTAHSGQEDVLHSMHLQVFVHPLYDLDFTQCEFCMFISMKEFLKDHRFTQSKDVYAAVMEWIQQETKEFFSFFWRGPISWYVNPL